MRIYHFGMNAYRDEESSLLDVLLEDAGVSGEYVDPPGGPPLVGGFFLKCVFSRLDGTFNVGPDEWARRCWTVFYVTPENMCR